MVSLGPLKHTRNKKILLIQTFSADRAEPGQIILNAKHAAPDVHQPIPASGE